MNANLFRGNWDEFKGELSRSGASLRTRISIKSKVGTISS